MKNSSSSLFTDVVKVAAGSASHFSHPIIKEELLKITIKGIGTYEMIYSTGCPAELVTGFLFTQGMIRAVSDIICFELDAGTGKCSVALKPLPGENRDKPMIRGSSGGYQIPAGPGLARGRDRTEAVSCPRLSSGQISALMELHYRHSILFQQTGAVHSAGLTDNTRMLFFFEDIGRHNALDKLAGHMLKENIDPSGKVITLSCRISLEIIQKVIRMGIRVVLSNAATTLSAVELAQKQGVTLVGFARGDQFNIYSHPERISIPCPCVPA